MHNNKKILIGKIVHGFKRGRKIGFPTANIKLTDTNVSLPKHGVYVSRVTVNGKMHDALTNIGAAKTFDATIPTIEPHILDFDEDIYGETIEVVLGQYLRGMIKFANADELSQQLTKDCQQIRDILNKENLK